MPQATSLPILVCGSHIAIEHVKLRSCCEDSQIQTRNLYKFFCNLVNSAKRLKHVFQLREIKSRWLCECKGSEILCPCMEV